MEAQAEKTKLTQSEELIENYKQYFTDPKKIEGRKKVHDTFERMRAKMNIPELDTELTFAQAFATVIDIAQTQVETQVRSVLMMSITDPGALSAMPNDVKIRFILDVKAWFMMIDHLEPMVMPKKSN